MQSAQLLHHLLFNTQERIDKVLLEVGENYQNYTIYKPNNPYNPYNRCWELRFYHKDAKLFIHPSKRIGDVFAFTQDEANVQFKHRLMLERVLRDIKLLNKN